MSRLYCWIDSDTRKTTLTTRAAQEIRIQVNHGSKDNSKKAFSLYVSYKKNTTKPKILLMIPDNMEKNVETQIQKGYPR